MIASIAPITSVSVDTVAPSMRPGAPVSMSFTQMMSDGLDQANARLLEADRLTQAFALGQDVPIHQVTFALEQARLSFELANQVRTRLLEGYQELMRMQV